MKDFKLTYYQFSERSILIQWPQKIDEIILQDVLIFKKHLLNSGVESILQINNTYNSILVFYQSTIDNIYDEFLLLKEQYIGRISTQKRSFKHWKIPVCYDERFGVDLKEISKENGLSITDIIHLHSKTIYTVYFIGFLPGFLYLGGLDKRLHFSRKKQPRLKVEKGAVAIGYKQTGIYPNSSPAGWNIIGNSPLNFFDVTFSKPCFAKAGDKIEFVPITLEMHGKILEAVQSGSYNLENRLING